MYELPKEPAKLRQRIRRYERAFEKEKAEYGSLPALTFRTDRWWRNPLRPIAPHAPYASKSCR